MEPSQQRGPRQDEEQPEHDEKDEQVVHAEGVLDQIAGHELERASVAEPEVQREGEPRGASDPEPDHQTRERLAVAGTRAGRQSEIEDEETHD